MKYRKAIVLFSGFRQSDSARSSFEDGYFNYISHYQRSGVICYAPRTWKSDVKALADQLRRQGVENIALVTYSHGQAAACDFAKYAETIGLTTDLWVACDPIYRPSWLPRNTFAQLFSFRAMCKKVKIKPPKAIQRIVYLRQDKGLPMGHEIVGGVCAGVIHGFYHLEIDSSPEWWQLVKSELNNFAL
jgi:hypothetical protein